MFERLMKRVKWVCSELWCHRLAYAGLALAYGGACMGWLDKETLNQIVMGLYIAITTQRH